MLTGLWVATQCVAGLISVSSRVVHVSKKPKVHSTCLVKFFLCGDGCEHEGVADTDDSESDSECLCVVSHGYYCCMCTVVVEYCWCLSRKVVLRCNSGEKEIRSRRCEFGDLFFFSSFVVVRGKVAGKGKNQRFEQMQMTWDHMILSLNTFGTRLLFFVHPLLAFVLLSFFHSFPTNPSHSHKQQHTNQYDRQPSQHGRRRQLPLRQSA